jgi:RNA 2',3'-cyclic 3'-phosphodiesterase
MALLRLFIAADISGEQREGVSLLMNALQKGIHFTNAHPAWVGVESLHITLKFLGNVESSTVDRISRALEPELRRFPAFRFSVQNLGIFPNPHRPQVLWIGMKQGAKGMRELQALVDRVLAPMGFKPEQRAFHPHLTLARIKSLRGAEAMMDIVNSHKHSDVGESDLTFLTLYESHLSTEGATYEVVRRWPLLDTGEPIPNEPELPNKGRLDT